LITILDIALMADAGLEKIFLSERSPSAQEQEIGPKAFQ
jgi:hypothetical protein